ncbi:MAG TPA: hypothetical protein VEI53_10055, partial [Ktedonobacteraceae bacterium]|nr:hypothetical protein [Ktedonobacteraceae bacterium]
EPGHLYDEAVSTRAVLKRPWNGDLPPQPRLENKMVPIHLVKKTVWEVLRSFVWEQKGGG